MISKTILCLREESTDSETDFFSREHCNCEDAKHHRDGENAVNIMSCLTIEGSTTAFSYKQEV